MKLIHVMAALLPVSLSATPTTAQPRTRSGAITQAHGSEGREVAAPSWSAACMTDHGPSECGQPMWIYGSSDLRAAP
jgi:hypothetical protein